MQRQSDGARYCARTPARQADGHAHGVCDHARCWQIRYLPCRLPNSDEQIGIGDSQWQFAIQMDRTSSVVPSVESVKPPGQRPVLSRTSASLNRRRRQQKTSTVADAHIRITMVSLLIICSSLFFFFSLYFVQLRIAASGLVGEARPFKKGRQMKIGSAAFWKLLGWDGGLPLLVAVAPVLVKAVFAKRDMAEVLTAGLLPIMVAMIRANVGRNKSPGCAVAHFR